MRDDFKKISSYYKPYIKTFVLDLLLASTSSLIALVIPFLIRSMMNIVLKDLGLAFKYGLFFCASILFLLFIFYFCNFYIMYYGHVMGIQIEVDMKKDLFEHYEKLPISFYSKKTTGQIMSRITVDLNNIGEFMHHMPENLVICLFKICGALLILFHINLLFSLICSIFLLFILFQICHFAPKIAKASLITREKIAKVNGQINESIVGIMTIQSFSNENFEIDKFKKLSNAYKDSKKNLFKIMTKFYPANTSLILSLIPLITFTGLFFVSNKLISTIDLVTFVLYISILVGPLFSLVSLIEHFQDNMSGIRRFLEVLKIDPEIKDTTSSVSLSHVEGNITFQNVSFKYGEKYIFKGLNLNIKKGEYVTLVGFSGVGKSTLCNLIPRFYDINEGSIEIDGIDIKKIKLKDLRENIGFINQDTYLFTGSVLENILYGKLESSKEEVVRAAKCANAHEFIINLPNGYRTTIGEKGITLSAGQKQRISLARMFLKKPPILIFDEATAFLDYKSEKCIQQSLQKLAVDCTTIVVTHKLSSIKKSRRILFLHNSGNIVEDGTHDNLMSKKGYYYDFYMSS